MSDSYYKNSGIFPDKTFSDLTAALDKGDSKETYRGEIMINLRSSDKTCKGDNTEKIPGKDKRIEGRYVTIKTPSDVVFIGLATLNIRGDDWKSKDKLRNSYVLWTGSSNDPQYNGINGNIIGAVKEYNPGSGKIILQGKGSNSYYIKDGKKINL